MSAVHHIFYYEMFQYFWKLMIFIFDGMFLTFLDAHHCLRDAYKSIETFPSREYNERPTLNTT